MKFISPPLRQRKGTRRRSTISGMLVLFPYLSANSDGNPRRDRGHFSTRVYPPPKSFVIKYLLALFTISQSLLSPSCEVKKKKKTIHSLYGPCTFRKVTPGQRCTVTENKPVQRIHSLATFRSTTNFHSTPRNITINVTFSHAA